MEVTVVKRPLVLRVGRPRDSPCHGTGFRDAAEQLGEALPAKLADGVQEPDDTTPPPRSRRRGLASSMAAPGARRPRRAPRGQAPRGAHRAPSTQVRTTASSPPTPRAEESSVGAEGMRSFRSEPIDEHGCTSGRAAQRPRARDERGTRTVGSAKNEHASSPSIARAARQRPGSAGLTGWSFNPRHSFTPLESSHARTTGLSGWIPAPQEVVGSNGTCRSTPGRPQTQSNALAQRGRRANVHAPEPSAAPTANPPRSGPPQRGGRVELDADQNPIACLPTSFSTIPWTTSCLRCISKVCIE